MTEKQKRVLEGLEPQAVFQYFEELCAIPHGSGNTKQISDYLVQFAKEQGLTCEQDAYHNVVIRKGGTAGYEHAPVVMLQGHMDMVCEKEPGCEIDFEQEGLQLQVNDGIISAEGTTLGGDDGISVAYALAILASDSIPHPPLEAVFTVDEEIGMLGAAAMDTSSLRASVMLNMDSEEEGYLLVSCAGGTTAVCHLPAVWEKQSGLSARLTVSGGLGGHSGTEIDKGRANANQVLARALFRLSRETELRICSVCGGKKDNAIPTESMAELVFVETDDVRRSDGAVLKLIRQMNEALQEEYAATDPGLRLSLLCAGDSETPVTRGIMAPAKVVSGKTESAGQQEKSSGTTEIQALSAEATKRVITALYNLPGGVQRMSFDIPGLVQTSLNMGILETTAEEVRMSFSVRSSLESEKQELLGRMSSLIESVGGTLTHAGDYPAWEYQKESPLRELMVQVFREQYGREPVVHAIHAGVECGLFAGKMSGLDCVSFGPDMKDIHTPRESMNIASVQRTWAYLLEVLKRLTGDFSA